MMTKVKSIVLTGGGSVGHVAPNIALIEKFQQEGWQVSYIGSHNGIEKNLVMQLNVPYYSVATGKLRRYFSWQNFLDPGKIFLGIGQAIFLLRRLKPDLVFSKGGFVAFPVVIAAWLNRIPVFIHESDLSLGLANRMCLPFATKVCVAFPETKVRSKKVVVTGIPIRNDILHGVAQYGRTICGFSAEKKILLVFGGSLGAKQINKIIRQLLPKILSQFQVVHICGQDNIDQSYSYDGYKQFAYLDKEFSHVLAAADFVISRAGANSIYELLILRKPNILIPLQQDFSRGDQILNAQYCADKEISELILSEQLTAALLLEKIYELAKKQVIMLRAMQNFNVMVGATLIFTMVQEVVYAKQS